MDAEDFFSRWSRRAAESKAAQAPEQKGPAEKTPVPTAQAAQAEQAPAASVGQRPVTLEDVAALTKDSDYSPFVAKGIDETVKRSAMKKLFSDPHFNVMDGLDIYIDDYSVFEPLKPATLLALNHAQALLDPLKHIQSTMLSLVQETGKEEAASGDQAGDGQAHTQVIEDQKAGQNTVQAVLQMEEGTQKEENLKEESFKEQNIQDALLENQTPADIPDSTKPAEQ